MKDGGAGEFRRSIGADILEAMKASSDLPLPNVQRLAKVMAEYFHKEGYIDDVKERGYKWRPDVYYWQNNIQSIAEYMRKERKKYFIYLREDGKFIGLWEFVCKAEYDKALRREYAGIATRTDTFNDRLTDGQERWQLEIPHISEVPLLN